MGKKVREKVASMRASIKRFSALFARLICVIDAFDLFDFFWKRYYKGIVVVSETNGSNWNIVFHIYILYDIVQCYYYLKYPIFYLENLII